MNDKITFLIRYHEGRLDSIHKCIDSIFSQTYENVEIIISYASHKELSDLTDTLWVWKNIKYVKVTPEKSLGSYFYNLYCNDLKMLVSDSWFMYIDSDDYIESETSVAEIMKDLTNPDEAIICQFKRGINKLKPTDEMIDGEQIINGRIGMPCIILHSNHKDVTQFSHEENADYDFIKKVYRKMKVKFVKKVVVSSPRRNFGK
jgi:hypothetical protein